MFFFFLLAKPGSPATAKLHTQVTSLAIKWTAPADDGGSPITAYRVVVIKGVTEIRNTNITDPGTTSWNEKGLVRGTKYTVKVLARNAVFEGPAVKRVVKTKYGGNKMGLISFFFLIVLFVGVESWSNMACSRRSISWGIV